MPCKGAQGSCTADGLRVTAIRVDHADPVGVETNGHPVNAPDGESPLETRFVLAKAALPGEKLA